MVKLMKLLVCSIQNRGGGCKPTRVQTDNLFRLTAAHAKDALLKLPVWCVPFMVIDTETTGLYPLTGDEIISFAGVPVNGLEIDNEGMFTRFVNPMRGIPQEIQELTGIKPEHVEQAPDIYAVLEEFLQLAGNRVLVGHRLDFDLKFINHKLKKCHKRKLSHITLDTAIMFRALHPEVNHFTLDELVERYGISNEGRHTAAGDAVMTAKLFIALLEEAARTRKLYTLAQLTYTLYWRSMFTGQQR